MALFKVRRFLAWCIHGKIFFLMPIFISLESGIKDISGGTFCFVHDVHGNKEFYFPCRATTQSLNSASCFIFPRFSPHRTECKHAKQPGRAVGGHAEKGLQNQEHDTVTYCPPSQGALKFPFVRGCRRGSMWRASANWIKNGKLLQRGTLQYEHNTSTFRRGWRKTVFPKNQIEASRRDEGQETLPEVCAEALVWEKGKDKHLSSSHISELPFARLKLYRFAPEMTCCCKTEDQSPLCEEMSWGGSGLFDFKS